MGAAQCLILEHESHESNESLTPRGGFCFPTDLTDFHRFLTPRGVFAVSLSEYRCLQRRESVQICEICGRLFLNHNAKIQHFIFPTHRCSLLLTDTHRLSLINYNPQNEMFSHSGMKRYNFKNETQLFKVIPHTSKIQKNRPASPERNTFEGS